MSERFLSKAQLIEMTGLSQGAAQIRWLKANNVLHYIRADGQPRVPVDDRGLPVQALDTPRLATLEQPDFGALRAAR